MLAPKHIPPRAWKPDAEHELELLPERGLGPEPVASRGSQVEHELEQAAVGDPTFEMDPLLEFVLSSGSLDLGIWPCPLSSFSASLKPLRSPST